MKSSWANPFHRGDRVRLNAYYRERVSPRCHSKSGTVVTNPMYPHLVSIRWDGGKPNATSRSTYSIDFIERVADDVN